MQAKRACSRAHFHFCSGSVEASINWGQRPAGLELDPNSIAMAVTTGILRTSLGPQKGLCLRAAANQVAKRTSPALSGAEER